MATDFANYAIVPEAEPEKNEIELTVNAFRTTQNQTGLLALAMKLQELFLMAPGTTPDAIDMGVDVRSYVMEFMDSTTISELNQKANAQVRKYLPTSAIKSVEFLKSEVATDVNKLYVLVYLNKTFEEFLQTYFAIGFSNNSGIKSTSISTIYL